MPRVIETKHPYLRDGFWDKNRFWDNDMYTKSSKEMIEKSLNLNPVVSNLERT
jgi:hypothetical protein